MLHNMSKHSIYRSAECGQCPYTLGSDTVHLKDTWRQNWNVSSDLNAIQDQEVILHDMMTEMNDTMHSVGGSDMMTEMNDTMHSVGGSDRHLVSVIYSLQMMSLLDTQFSTQLNSTHTQVMAAEVYIIKVRLISALHLQQQACFR